MGKSRLPPALATAIADEEEAAAGLFSTSGEGEAQQTNDGADLRITAEEATAGQSADPGKAAGEAGEFPNFPAGLVTFLFELRPFAQAGAGNQKRRTWRRR